MQINDDGDDDDDKTRSKILQSVVPAHPPVRPSRELLSFNQLTLLP